MRFGTLASVEHITALEDLHLFDQDDLGGLRELRASASSSVYYAKQC